MVDGKGRGREVPADPVLVDLILRSIADGVFAVDGRLRITYFNAAAEDITGFRAEEALGRPCSEIFRAELCRERCPLKESLRTGRKVSNRSIEITTRAGQTRTISVATAALAEAGELVGAVEAFRDISRIRALERDAALASDRMEGIVGRSPPIQRLFELLPTIAGSEATILIDGESGTGKGLFARAIHDLSPRSGGPFVHVNCGAIPETLLEAELFGHTAGAFTGAKGRRVGRFEAAAGGTIFLDEIGDAPLSTQVRLLRVLQEREFEPVGSSRTVQADVRVLAATNRSLLELVRQGLFREDLFYRLGVFHLEVPSLRERPEDLPDLVDEFIARFNRRQGGRIREVAPDAMRALLEYTYPGNVRELENIVQHMCIVAGGDRVRRADLPAYVFTGIHHLGPAPTAPRPAGRSAGTSRAELVRLLAEHDGNIPRMARALGVHRTTAWRMARREGLLD